MRSLEIRSWKESLSKYSYPVNLGCYEYSNQFPTYFNRNILGDRNSTIEFENYFRENALKSIEVYFEVIFWKLYSQERDRSRITDIIVNYVLREKINSESLYNAINRFTNTPDIQNLKRIRSLLGLKTPVLAVSLTFPAFFSPETYPMIDRNVARWVNSNLDEHNRNRQNRLSPFVSEQHGRTSLQDVDFSNYMNWVFWCRETAKILTDRTKVKWRARDVEMAVFTAERKKLQINVL